MIVPTRKLLFAAALCVPVAGTAGLVGSPALGYGVMAALAALALLDAFASNRLLSAVVVRLDPLVRLWRGREGRLPVVIESSGSLAALRFAVVPPAGVEVEPEEVEVKLPGGGAGGRTSVGVTARLRGRHRIETCRLETASRFGLWRLQRDVAVNAELRVYPDVLADRRRVAALFLNRGGHGVHARRQAGRGREFEKLRDYVQGDAQEDIHWKATAKRGHPVTKIFQIERTQEVFVAIDASRLTGRFVPDSEQTLLERAIASAVLLGRAAERQGDRFGLLSFSDRVHHFLRPAGGRQNHRAALDALCGLEPREVAPDFHALFSFVRSRLRRRSLLVVFTCLDDPVIAEDFARAVALVSRQHLVTVHALSPLPLAAVFEGPAPADVHGVYQSMAAHLVWERLEALRLDLRRRNVDLRPAVHESMTSQAIAAYLDVKRRQRL